MIVAGEGSLIRWNRWTGSWGTSATFDINTGATGAMNWLSLKADPASNRLMLASVDGSTDLCTASWNPTTWTVHTPHDTGVNTNAQRCADVEWEPTGSKVLMVYGTTSGRVSYKTWTPAGGWSGITTSTNTGTHPWIQLRRNPRSVSGDVKILGATLNSNNDIFGFKWDGTTLTFEETAFTADTVVVTYECFEIAFRIFGDPLDFDYVLKIVNQDTDWNINLKLYDSQNINRLGNVTISFHDGSTSDQIIISEGVITQSEGSLYDLPGSATTYIRIANPYVTASGTSYLYVYLKILFPSTSTYSLCIITFEII